MSSPPTTKPATPDEAVEKLLAHVMPVETETIAVGEAAGRVLAEKVALDRPSPACDVSAMDGYAVRVADLASGDVPVVGEVTPGSRAGELPRGAAVRVFTGAMLPADADAVIPREGVTELADRIHVSADASIARGQHIRRCGENAETGATVCEPGCVITPPRLAAIASCGHSTIRVHRRVRVGVLITGDEVRPVEAAVQPWELRDGNGYALIALFARAGWVELAGHHRVTDDRGEIFDAASFLLAKCDALLLTGGVSAGDYDHVPAILRDLGCEIVFHKIPIRPGKPVLGAIDSRGVPVLGLPGNPVSVMVTARLIAAPVLRARAGMAGCAPRELLVDARGDAVAPPKLRWYPLVRLSGDGYAEVVSSRGSGDWVAAAASDGFIEVPPGEAARGRRRFTPWTLADGSLD